MGVGWQWLRCAAAAPCNCEASSPSCCDALLLAAAKIWEGVANRYWRLPVYFVPTCVLKAADGEAEAAPAEQQGGDEATAAAAADAAAGEAGTAAAGGGAGS